MSGRCRLVGKYLGRITWTGKKSHFGRSLRNLSRKTTRKVVDLAKAGTIVDEGYMAEAKAETTEQEREEMCSSAVCGQFPLPSRVTDKLWGAQAQPKESVFLWKRGARVWSIERSGVRNQIGIDVWDVEEENTWRRERNVQDWHFLRKAWQNGEGPIWETMICTEGRTHMEKSWHGAESVRDTRGKVWDRNCCIGAILKEWTCVAWCDWCACFPFFCGHRVLWWLVVSDDLDVDFRRILKEVRDDKGCAIFEYISTDGPSNVVVVSCSLLDPLQRKLDTPWKHNSSVFAIDGWWQEDLVKQRSW